MIFLAVLALATAGTAVVVRGRCDHRTIARLGLGIALAVAGATHFVNPTPFEQHLPSWVPASGLVVALSGVAEVALGIALLAAWPSGIAIGRTVAAFFVAVLPANVYVAVAGVDVDGQPGGLYPWIRLPLQFLFVAWALWSTQPAHADDNPPTQGAMPPLRWITGPAAHSASDAGAETVAMASLLELRRLRDVPRFLVAALRLRRLFASSPGAIRLSLTAIPLRTTFWTLSQWESHAGLDAYTRHPSHIDVMRTFAPRMAGSTFTTWANPAPRGPRGNGRTPRSPTRGEPPGSNTGDDARPPATGPTWMATGIAPNIIRLANHEPVEDATSLAGARRRLRPSRTLRLKCRTRAGRWLEALDPCACSERHAAPCVGSSGLRRSFRSASTR